MEVIPAVDMKDGDCVQLVQGEEGTGKTYGDPVEAAQTWVDAGAETLHIVDLDGAIHGERKNSEEVGRIIDETSVGVQVGGGIRSVEDARSFFDAGADRVIMGTAAVENPEIVEEVSEYGDTMVSLDSKGDEVVVEGWKEGSGLSPVELASKFEEIGAESILYTDVDREGLLDGVETSTVSQIVEEVSIRVVASGGVSSLEDIEALRDTGADGVVVGTALYERRMSLQDAKEAARV
ncbi:MAG: 1-(5-phosphoribosyl)-5-[(5-phosphoribosylamino)methylideneamino]imidazole-4-carboxamide isomerase [Halobacteria archaeon]|nr:1-(5-phosphoribosyl)-5-[(5-phosphoribosylamino)methylideneamino]imidazole-4-carboxamide isomerase [Halobacteria archaeon]